MDNMAAGWDRPQEDEFALCNMGVPSPYLTIIFPNRPPQCQEYLDFRGVPAPALERWKRALHWFLKCITLRNPKRIVLKSPAHTCRIGTLLEMFPKAKFVHIVRDPYVIFPSTINLWKRLYRDQGLQMPTYDGLEEHVFQTFTRMYDTFERDRHLIGPGQFCEVRYEELIADPVGQMRRSTSDWDWAISRPFARRSKSMPPARRTTRPTAIRSRRRCVPRSPAAGGSSSSSTATRRKPSLAGRDSIFSLGR